MARSPSALHPTFTIPIAFVRGMPSGGRAHGWPADEYLADAGIEPQLLEQSNACVRLNTSPVPLAALADELGFGDSAGFQRAFKNWTGSAAGACRRGADVGIRAQSS